MAKTSKEFRAEVTQKFVDMLTRGEAPPWRKPWDAKSMKVPQNAESGRAYRGANAYSLMIAGMGKTDHRWVTSAQLHKIAEEQLKKAGFDPIYDKNVKDKKGNITHKGMGWLEGGTGEIIPRGHIPTLKKGAQYETIEFWKSFDEKKVDKEDGTKETVLTKRDRPMAQLFYVYNLGDVENLTLPRLVEKAAGHEHAPIEAAEKLVAATGAVIKHHQSDKAYYAPSLDEIHMPAPEAFPTREAYYGTAMHELGHWTSHKDRLDRDISTYGTDITVRAKEELRAELSSVFMAAETGIMPDLANHGAYLASWAEALKKDPNELFRAAADAQKIADFVLGRGRDKEQEQGVATAPEKEVVVQPAAKGERALKASRSHGR